MEQAALQLAVEAEPRLLLATEPPAASQQQPLTLAMAQEAKYALFFLCGLARLSGQVRRGGGGAGRLANALGKWLWRPTALPAAHAMSGLTLLVPARPSVPHLSRFPITHKCMSLRNPCPTLQWRLMLPGSLPAFRRATAAFLDFAASPRNEPISCAPVSASERAAARAGGTGGEGSKAGGGGALVAAGGSSKASSSAALTLGKGWFDAVAAGAGGSSTTAAAGGYVWQLAERLYSSAQYALAFQLALAPEVGEEELADLGPEWVRPATLLALQASSCLVTFAGKLAGMGCCA